MFNFSPSPELLKKYLGGPMPQQGTGDINSGMPGGMPMGLDVGSMSTMPMQRQMMAPISPMPPAQPPMMPGMNVKQMPNPAPVSGGIMKRYAGMDPSSSEVKQNNPNKRRSY